MKPKYIYCACMAASMMMLAACSDKNEWQPGEAAPDNMGVFFTNLDNYDMIVEADDSRVFSVGVGRINSSEAASVPIKLVTAPEGVAVPAAVEFEAGKESASFEIDITDMPLKTSGDIILQIDPAYAALYGAGTSEMKMKVTTTGGWELLADDVVISCYSGSGPDLSTSMYVLDGTNRFKIPDFLNSGTDLVFTVPDPTLQYQVIFPYTNYMYYYDIWPEDYEDDTDYPWYFYDTEKAAYPAIWTPDGWSKSISYVSFYTYDGPDYTGCYMNINKGDGMLMSYIEFADGSGSWEYFMFDFKAKFDPFAQQ